MFKSKLINTFSLLMFFALVIACSVSSADQSDKSKNKSIVSINGATPDTVLDSSDDISLFLKVDGYNDDMKPIVNSKNDDENKKTTSCEQK